MNTNSLLAYSKLNLTKGQRKVYEMVCESGGMTMKQVADALIVEKNTISGRFGELVKEGVLEVKSHVIENGSRVGVYRIKENKTNFEEMRQELINSWRKPVINSDASLF